MRTRRSPRHQQKRWHALGREMARLARGEAPRPPVPTKLEIAERALAQAIALQHSQRTIRQLERDVIRERMKQVAGGETSLGSRPCLS
jgi:hypothetical protein